MLAFWPATREDNLDDTQAIQDADSFGQAIFSGFTQPDNVVALTAVSQDVPAVPGEPVDGCSVADGDRRYQRPRVVPRPMSKVLTSKREKNYCIFWEFCRF